MKAISPAQVAELGINEKPFFKAFAFGVTKTSFVVVCRRVNGRMEHHGWRSNGNGTWAKSSVANSPEDTYEKTVQDLYDFFLETNGLEKVAKQQRLSIN